MGKSTINIYKWPFSIAILVHQRVDGAAIYAFWGKLQVFTGDLKQKPLGPWGRRTFGGWPGPEWIQSTPWLWWWPVKILSPCLFLMFMFFHMCIYIYNYIYIYTLYTCLFTFVTSCRWTPQFRRLHPLVCGTFPMHIDLSKGKSPAVASTRWRSAGERRRRNLWRNAASGTTIRQVGWSHGCTGHLIGIIKWSLNWI